MNLLSVSDLRQKISDAVDQVVTQQQPLTILKHSKPQAVLVSHDYFIALEQAVMDLTDALEAEKAKSEPTMSLDKYITKRWPV